MSQYIFWGFTLPSSVAESQLATQEGLRVLSLTSKRQMNWANVETLLHTFKVCRGVCQDRRWYLRHVPISHQVNDVHLGELALFRSSFAFQEFQKIIINDDDHTHEKTKHSS